MALPPVSVIIPNRNSPLVARTIDSLFAQTAFDQIREILVVGVDQPGLIVERGPLRFIPTQGAVTAPVARNIGIRQAQGAFLAFIDADCIADPGWLAALLGQATSARQVIGGSVSLEGNDYWQLCYNLTMFHEFLYTTSPGPRFNLGTLNLLVARSVIENVGLLDETLPRCQDTEWTVRMRKHGYALDFEPRAVIQHLPQATGIAQLWKLWERTGYFSCQIRQLYPELLSPPPFHKAPLFLFLLAPLIGGIVTTRIALRNPRLLRYLYVFPVIFLTKMAWCIGASRKSLPA